MATNPFENSGYYIPPKQSSAVTPTQSSMTNVTEVISNPKLSSTGVQSVSISSSSSRRRDIASKAATQAAIQKSAAELAAKGISGEGVVYDTSGKGYSQGITPKTESNVFINQRGQKFSAAPSTVVKSASPSILGVQKVEFYSGEVKTVKTGSTTVYNKEYLSGSAMFQRPTAFRKIGRAYSSTTESVNSFVQSKLLSRLIKESARKDSLLYQGSYSSKPAKELFSVNLGGANKGKVSVGGSIKGLRNYVVYEPADFLFTAAAGSVTKKVLSIPIVTRATNTLGGRIVGTGVVGLTGVGVVTGYSAAKDKSEFIGKTVGSFGAFGLGYGLTSGGVPLGITIDKKTGLSNGLLFSKPSEVQPFAKGLTVFADVKRVGINPIVDRLNPYAIKAEPVKAFERGRTLPDSTVDVANIPGVGEVRFKAIPSQQAGLKELVKVPGKKQFIISATTRNPYRSGNLFQRIIPKKSYVVEYKGGADVKRAAVGGIELGQFYSTPEIPTGKAQAYIYYLDEGATLKDLSSGKASFSLLSRNRILIERTYISSYEKDTVSAIKGLSPTNPKQLKILQKFAALESKPGKTKAGFAGVAGYRTEAETISAIGSIKTELPATTLRGKYGKYIGLGDYYVRLSSGKKVEIKFQKTEPFSKTPDTFIMVKKGIFPFVVEVPQKVSGKVLKSDIIKTDFEPNLKDVARFDVSSSKSLRYSPYKDIAISSIGSVKSSKVSSKISSKVSSSSLSKVSSKVSASSVSSLSSVKSSVSVKSSISSLSSRSSLSSKSSTSSLSSRSSLSSKSSTSSGVSFIQSIKTSYPKFSAGISGAFKSFKSFRSRTPIKYGYTPTVEAVVFDIKGKRISKSLASSGLVLRPIVR